MLCSVVLVVEAVLVGLAAVVVSGLDQHGHRLVPVGAAALVLAAGLALGLLGKPAGYVLGSAVQVAVLAAGFVLPAMFLLGAVFTALWVAAITLPRRADRVRAARAAAASATGAGGTGAA